MTVNPSELSPGRVPGATRRSFDRRVFVAIGAVVVLVAGVGTVGYFIWRSDDTFCGRAAARPNLVNAVYDDTTPAAALRADADDLDRLAELAPDRDTADAARLLAHTQHAIADALDGDPTDTDAIAGIMAIDSAETETARVTLARSIHDACDNSN